MTKEKFLYGLNACAVTYHNGQKLYDHDELVKCFEDLGIFKQEPKTGRWIETAEEYYKAVNEYGGGVNENTPYFVDDIACSECLAKYSVIDNETERFDHCPSCGAKMDQKGGEE